MAEIGIAGARPAVAPAGEFAGIGSKPYRAYVLAMLFVIYAVNLLDRSISGLLQDPIKHEFGLSDFELGLLGGPTFALFYALLGVPIARVAERWNRVSIIAIATATWSAMTVLCGLAVSYPMLLLARMGVGVGEAGSTPPSQSVISDYFPANKRAAAIAIYLVSIPMGVVFASAIGGPIADHYGWRMAFIALGAPGVLVALLFKLTVREPPRSGGPAEKAPSFGAALKEVSNKGSFWHIAFAAGLANFVGVGNGQYAASFLLRVHHLSLSWVGIIIGPVMNGVSAITVYFVGALINRLMERDKAWLARWPGIGLLCSAPLSVAAYLAPTWQLWLPLAMLAALCANAYLISVYTTAQCIVSPRIRATSAALVLLCLAVLGYGFGPPAIGALSDFMQAQVVGLGLADNAHKEGEGLRWALVLGATVYAWSGVHFLIGSTKLKKDWVG